jgi:hypothetical protein
MLIAKRQIVELLLDRGDHARAIRADEELPGLIHVEVHSGLLEELGLDPALLMRDVQAPGRRFDRRGIAVRGAYGAVRDA